MCKISIITATYNSANTILKSLNSVIRQDNTNFEHIIIDGLSIDGTTDLINDYINRVNNRYKVSLISELDFGIYDALNKGIKYATGDYIVFLHSDDEFNNPYVINHISCEIEKSNPDIMWSNLIFIKNEKIHRYWKSSKYRNIALGWIPPHPTLIVRKIVYDAVGGFDLAYKISSDYDHMLRIFSRNYKLKYINKCLYNMSVGGVSTRKSLIFTKIIEDNIILKKRYPYTFLFIYLLKVSRKIIQFYMLQRHIHLNHYM
jgi:glycosyltransferase